MRKKKKRKKKYLSHTKMATDCYYRHTKHSYWESFIGLVEVLSHWPSLPTQGWRLAQNYSTSIRSPVRNWTQAMLEERLTQQNTWIPFLSVARFSQWELCYWLSSVLYQTTFFSFAPLLRHLGHTDQQSCSTLPQQSLISISLMKTW